MNKEQLTDDYGVRLQYSGKGHFDFDINSIYANLEGTEIDVESNFMLAFNIDGIEIISYTNANVSGMSIKDQIGHYQPIFGISVIDSQTGLLSPVWNLSETHKQRIFRYIEDYQDTMTRIVNVSIINSDLTIEDLVGLLDGEKILFEIESLLDKHEFKPSFLEVQVT